ncbi:hypothetical protein KR018_002714, partial [Drosophila ironensis]
MVQGVSQGSGVHHRLDEGSGVDHRHGVHHWSSVHHRDGVNDGSSVHHRNGVDNWSSVDNRDWSGVDRGLQDGSHHGLDNGLAVDLGDALVGNSRGSRVDHSSNLGQNGLVHHMVGLNKSSAGGGHQEGNDGDL